MNYADLTNYLRNEGYAPGYILNILKDLGYSSPLDRDYNETDLRKVREEAIVRRHEARKGSKSEVHIIPSLAQGGLWFKASHYRVDKNGWIEAAPGAKVEQYPLDEVLDKLVPDLENLGEHAELVQVLREERKGPVPQDENEDDAEWTSSLPEEEIIKLSPKSEDAFIDFYNRYGPLGLAFRDIWEIRVRTLDGRTEIATDPFGMRRVPLKEHFGDRLKPGKYSKKQPIEEILPGTRASTKHQPTGYKLDFHSLCLCYREHGYDAALAAAGFKLCAREIAQGPGIFWGQTPRHMEEAFLHSRPEINYVDGIAKPKLTWRPNSLLDAAFLHLFKVALTSGYRICKDPKCGKLFRIIQGRGRPREYCSKRCQERHIKELSRARAKQTE